MEVSKCRRLNESWERLDDWGGADLFHRRTPLHSGVILPNTLDGV